MNKALSIFNQLRPLSVGFDDVFDTFESFFDSDLRIPTINYPPYNIVKTGIPISGLYQLDPIRETTIADALGLDDEESLALSPHFFEPKTEAPILVTLGGGETPEFHWQTDNFVSRWKDYKAPLDYFAEPEVDHFGVVERLSNKDSEIFNKVKEWLL